MLILSKPILPFIEYVALYDYIKKELCINVDKPELACDGKCHLVKQIVKTTESDEEDKKVEITAVYNFVLFHNSISNYFIRFSAYKIIQKISDYQYFMYSSIARNTIYRPPIFI